MPAIPADAEGLTPAWLSDVLGADVIDVEVSDQDSATNQRLRLRLTYGSSQPGPESLFVKLAPVDPVHRELIGASRMGRREVDFYRAIAPSIELRVPRVYWADSSDEGAFVLLLEDLAGRGCTFSDGAWGVGADAAAVALEGLARFHARFGEASVRSAVAPWLAQPAIEGGEIIPQLLRGILEEHRDELTDAYVTAGHLYAEHHLRFDQLWDSGPQTCIHGDPHIGNVFLEEGRVGFFDWGLCRESTPLRDVSYFLTMTVEPDDRRAAERDLIRLYVDALSASGGAKIDFDDAWFTHRVQAGYTVVATFLAFMPTYAGPAAQTLGAALRRRSEMALEDLESVDAMKAALTS